MKKNMGKLDRAIRLVLGVAGVAIALTGISRWGWVGLLPLATGFINWCPLYSVLGWDTHGGR